MPIAVGQPAPEFTLKDQNQKEIKLSDFAGKRNVVLMFYPLDFSPICTTEHACFVNDLKQFEKLDAQVLGLSVDSVWTHKAFAGKMGITYPLLADFHPKGAVADRYGMYNANKLKIGLFGPNCSSGRAVTLVPERWSGSWPDNLRLARMADEAGIDFLLPIGRWKGYGGDTDYQGETLETLTWASGLLASTRRITVR